MFKTFINPCGDNICVENDFKCTYVVIHYTFSYTRLTALFWDYPGEPVPER